MIWLEAEAGNYDTVEAEVVNFENLEAEVEAVDFEKLEVEAEVVDFENLEVEAEAVKIYCFQTLCRIQPHHMEQLVSWLTAMNCLVSFLARFPSMSYEMRSKAVNVVP